jgi:hypothetical protein
MKKILAALVLCICYQGSANAGCKFSWHHYGDNTLRDLVAQEIGGHVSDTYCAMFGDKYEIVVQFNAYTLSNMVAGHSIVGIRKKGSKSVPSENYSALVTDTSGRTAGAANNKAVQATLSALDDLMSELRSYKASE